MMKYLSLFSGIGGFELGIENSDVEMECIGFSEVDERAKAIYRKHFPNHKDLGDATKIDPTQLEDFDLLVGGFPCQAFSYAGKRRGLDDTRGTLFFEIARICKEKKPRYLLLENVPGLLSHDRGRTFKTFLGILTEMGYDIRWEIHNSKNYGTPQNRERLFIKGYLREECGREILRSTRQFRENSARCEEIKFARQVVKRKNDGDIEGLKQLLKDAKNSSNGLTVSSIAESLGLPKTHVEHWFRSDSSFAIPNADKWYELKEILGIRCDDYDAFVTEFEVVEGKYDKSKRAYSEDGLSPTLTSTAGEMVVLHPGKQATRILDENGISCTLCGLGGGQGGKGGLYAVSDDDEVCRATLTPTRPNKRQNGRRMKENGEPMFTITASDVHGVFNGRRVRRLTPVEFARLQAFPDDWADITYNGKPLSDNQKYKVFGNAVTTTVITWIINDMFGGD